MDPIILGENYKLEGGIGSERPNDNQLIVGATGCGKTMSCLEPTILNLSESSCIAVYSKEESAMAMAAYMQTKGYQTQIMNLAHPERSDVFYEPLMYLRTEMDVYNLASMIVEANSSSVRYDENYWTYGSKNLLVGLIQLAKHLEILDGEKATMSSVMRLLEQLRIASAVQETYARSKGEYLSYRSLWKRQEFRGSTNAKFYRIAETFGQDCGCFTRYLDYENLPESTAGCMRSSAMVPMYDFFPESVRRAMTEKPPVEFAKIAQKRTALFIITSAVNTATYNFANLVMQTAIKELLEYADLQPGQRLPVPVKLFFDDFACGAPIQNFASQISIFRSAGISTMLLLQSESQLAHMYSEQEASIIMDNCSSYVFFFGSRDIRTCGNLSKLTNMPVDAIVGGPVGKVLILSAGQSPKITPRYDVLNSAEYKAYQRFAREKAKARRTERCSRGGA